MAGQGLDLNGYTDVPAGKIAFVVTFLEMLRAPETPLSRPRTDLALETWNHPEPDGYRQLFRAVGGDWIWFGRLNLGDEELRALFAEPGRKTFRLIRDGRPAGLLELDFANPEEPELAYFGLIPDAIGGGAGRWMMAQALQMVWARQETKRVWLHTCTGDSPQALPFYLSCGFSAYKRAIEIADDPRLTGLYPKDAAPQFPLIA